MLYIRIYTLQGHMLYGRAMGLATTAHLPRPEYHHTHRQHNSNSSSQLPPTTTPPNRGGGGGDVVYENWELKRNRDRSKREHAHSSSNVADSASEVASGLAAVRVGSSPPVSLPQNLPPPSREGSSSVVTSLSSGPHHTETSTTTTTTTTTTSQHIVSRVRDFKGTIQRAPRMCVISVYFHLNVRKLNHGPIRLLADHDFTV